jgi:hypothetical protein
MTQKDNIKAYVRHLLNESLSEGRMNIPHNVDDVFKQASDKSKLQDYIRITRESGKPEWEPLYIFLEGIFGDIYKKVADGFMFMQSIIVFGKKEVFVYKNGLTRKSVILDESGEAFEIDWKTVWVNDEEAKGGKTPITVPVSIYTITNMEAFDTLFKDYAKFIGVDKSNPYTTSYSAHAAERDAVLKGMGIKSVNGNNLDNLEDLKNK